MIEIQTFLFKTPRTGWCLSVNWIPQNDTNHLIRGRYSLRPSTVIYFLRSSDSGSFPLWNITFLWRWDRIRSLAMCFKGAEVCRIHLRVSMKSECAILWQSLESSSSVSRQHWQGSSSSHGVTWRISCSAGTWPTLHIRRMASVQPRRASFWNNPWARVGGTRRKLEARRSNL